VFTKIIATLYRLALMVTFPASLSIKSRKTFFKSMIEASYLGGNANQFCPSFKGHDTQDKYVISLILNKVSSIRKEYNVELLEMVNDNIYDKYKTFA
jgi:hypothetical protein